MNPLRQCLSALKRKYLEMVYQASPDDYDARRYWQDRHEKFGNDSLRGVGNQGLSESVNAEQYEKAASIFNGLLTQLALSPTASVLEVGYGTGFYTQLLYDYGFRQYTGFDITDVNTSAMEARMPELVGRLFQADIGSGLIAEKLSVPVSLAVMIDVTQHIVNPDKLAFALRENIAANLASGGTFIVTDSLRDEKLSFYERAYSLAFYEEALGFPVSIQPQPFRDKFIFAFTKP